MILGFSPGNNLTTIVKAAIGANVMRQSGVVALWAIGKIRRLDFPVSASLAASGFGMSSLWIWHESLRSRSPTQMPQSIPARV